MSQWEIEVFHIHMKRQYLAHGTEHRVYKAHRDGTVLKYPRLLTRVSRLLCGGVASVRQEYQAAQDLLDGSAVQVARTRIFASQRLGSYILVQEEVHEDHSVPDIFTYLQHHDQNDLAQRYVSNPHNFVSHQGTVYLIDFTKGIDIQWINTLDIISEQDYRQFRQRIRKFVNALGDQFTASIGWLIEVLKTSATERALAYRHTRDHVEADYI